MKTVRIANYTFDKVARTVTFVDFGTIELERIVSITDTTIGKQLFFNKFPNTTGAVAANVVTLATDTNNDGFANTDKLLIEYVVDNSNRTVVASRTETVTGTSNDITNYSADKGGVFHIDVTAFSGTTPTIVFKLQSKDHNGHYVDIPGAVTTSITGVAQKSITLYPGVTESANAKVSDVLPRTYRLAWTIGGTTPSFDFSMSLDPIQ